MTPAPYRILLVYHHAAVRAAHAAVLRGAGFMVLEAGSGNEALARLQEERPDLVLVSSILPDMQAADVCHRLRADARTSDIPIIQISGESDDTAEVARALEAGADMLLMEAAGEAALIDTTKAVLRMRATTDRLRRSQRLGALLAEAATLEGVLQVIETEMMRPLGSTGVLVALLTSDRKEFQVLTGIGSAREALQRLGSFSCDDATPVSDAIWTERPIFLETRQELAQRYPQLNGFHAVAGDGALVAAPLSIRGAVMGAIALCFPADRRFTSDERAFILAASRMCSGTMERARLSESEREAHRVARETSDRLASLQTVTASLSGAGSVDEVLDAMVTPLMRAFGADAGVVVVLAGSPPTLRCVRMQGFQDRHREQFHALPVDSAHPLAEAVRTGHSVVASLAEREPPDHSPAGGDPPTEPEVFVAIPLPAASGSIGSIGLRFSGARSLTPPELAWLQSMGRQCSQALQRAQLLDAERARAAELERKLADERNAVAKLELAQEAAHVGTWEHEGGSLDARCSAGYFRVFGLAPDREWHGFSEWLACIHPEDRAEAARVAEEAVRYERDFSALYRIRRPDGEIRWIRSRGRSVRSGGASRLIGAVTDVTHLVQAHLELRGWKDRHQALVQASRQIVYDWNPQSGEIRWEGAVKALLGYEPEELGGLDEIAMLVHPEDRRAFDDEVAHVIQDHAPFRLDYRVRRKDGSYAWIRDSGYFVSKEQGSVVRVAGFMQDITAEHEAQIRLSVAQRAAKAGVWDCDLVTGELRWTDEYRRLFDIDLAAPASRELWLSLIIPEDREPTEERFRMILEQKREDVEVQYRVLRGARIRWFAAVGRVYYESGVPVRMTGITIDITDRKLAEEAVRETGQLETLGQLAGGIAHQFNNLLTGVLGNASMLLYASALTPEDRDMVQGIVNSSQHAAHLVRQLLAYSGQGRFHLERLQISQLVERLRDLMLPSLPKHVTLQVDASRELPVVEADAVQIQQVVLNLVLNAGEAIPEDRQGRVRVRTGVEELDAETAEKGFAGQKVAAGSYVYVEVRDNGAGMNQDTLQRIFDPFFTTKFLGRGLGLAAVAGIIRGHRGGIRVRSQMGQGSDFRIYLPCVAARPPQNAPRESARVEHAVILVVDDEEVILNLAASALVRLGYQVHVAAGGWEALAILDANPAVDLVLLDLAMPDMGGIETYEEIRRRRPGLRVLISSGYNQAEATRQLRGEPTAGYLQKPYTVQALSGAVRLALES